MLQARTRHYFWILMLAMSFVVAGAMSASAKTELVSKVDSFVLFVDHSGSMAMSNDAGDKKIALAKDLLGKMNAKIPSLEYDSRLATFAPYARMYSGMYESPGMGKAIEGIADDYEIYGRLTPMGGGFGDVRPSLDALGGQIAVIVFSDGENNSGVDPIAAASDIYNSFKGRVCFHVVSFADKPEGQAVLDAISKLSGCSVSAVAADLLADEAALDQFVRDVFFDVREIPEPKPAPAPKPEPMAEVIPLRIHFDFDSAKIRDDMAPILDEAASILGERKGGVMLQGHTCNIGPEAYNQGLSERRAESVKKYLTGKGIDAGRMTTEGKGEAMPKYDNETREGRKLNRRVEIVIQ